MTTPREGAARRASKAEYRVRETDPRPLMTVRQAADHLAVSPSTVWRLIRQDRLRAVLIGSTYRIRPADLDAYLARAAS